MQGTHEADVEMEIEDESLSIHEIAWAASASVEQLYIFSDSIIEVTQWYHSHKLNVFLFNFNSIVTFLALAHETSSIQ